MGLTVSPNPAAPNAGVDVEGYALATRTKYRLWREDPKYGRVGVTTNQGRTTLAGTFKVGILLSGYVGTQTIGCELYQSGAWKVVATTTVTVQVTPPPDTTGPWFGKPDPWAGIPFGSLPLAPSGQMWISGDQGGRRIERLTFKDRPAGQNVIVLDGVRNLTIDLLDFDTVPEGIYAANCQDVTIGRIRARNIFGPFTRTGFHSGNLLQLIWCKRFHISDIKVAQPATIPPGYGADYGTEDIINLGGDPGTWGGDSWDAPFLIERFAIDGGAWQSWSGTGFLVGDGRSGKYVWVRDGILYRPGQVGIGVAEEGPYRFERIDIVGPQRNGSNDSIQHWGGNLEMGHIRTDWRKADGTKVGPNLMGHPFTDLGGNEWLATLPVPQVTL